MDVCEQIAYDLFAVCAWEWDASGEVEAVVQRPVGTFVDGDETKDALAVARQLFRSIM
jgi:hypothetical protein